jgi:pantetheine-phosphate adenylyltransferase
MMTDYKWMYLSSTIVKEVATHGGNIKGLVPDCVITPLYKRCQERLRAQEG